MNLLDILRTRAASLPKGEYTLGIKAVVQHVEVASKHLLRGQESGDETMFTDAIYRTNQAFEGSLKEAFRVLAGKDPSRKTPNDIEAYLQQQNLLRSRVLAQFTNYRKEWRNPSTHDYRLDFDEDEALLAIVTVSAFAIVLIDQITERISFEQAKAATPPSPVPHTNTQPLIDRVSMLIEQFVTHFNQSYTGGIRETEVTGALAGFLTSAAPEVTTQVESKLVPDRSERADLLLSSGPNCLLVEIKRIRFASGLRFADTVQRVSHYMALSGITQAILFVFSTPNSGKLTRTEQFVPETKGRIVILSTEHEAA